METILGMSASFSSLFILSFLFHKFHLSLILVLKCLPNPHPFHPNPLYIIVLVQYTFTTMCVFQDPGKETTAASLYILEVKKKCHQRVTLVYLSCSSPLIVALLPGRPLVPFSCRFFSSLFHIQNHENIHIYIG